MDQLDTPICLWLVRKPVFDQKVIPHVHIVALEAPCWRGVGHVVLKGVC